MKIELRNLDNQIIGVYRNVETYKISKNDEWLTVYFKDNTNAATRLTVPTQIRQV